MNRSMTIIATTLLMVASAAWSQEPKTEAKAEEMVADPDYQAKVGDRSVALSVTQEGRQFRTWAALTSYNYRDYTKSLLIDDKDELEELRKQGSVVYLAPLTPILVLGIETIEIRELRKTRPMANIRVLDGELKGQKFYVAAWNIARMIPRSELAALEAKKAELEARKKAAIRPSVPAPTVPTFTPEELVKKAEAKEDAKKEARAKRAVALLQLGKNYEKGAKPKAALESYKKLVDELGDTPSAKDATERIKALDPK